MARNVAAERYAQALFEVGEKHRQDELFYQSLDLLHDYLETYPDLPRLLYNPLIRPQDKIDLLKRILPADTSPLFLNFVGLVVGNRRERLFPQIHEDFARLYNRAHRRVRAQVTTAVDLKPGLAELLKKQLQACLEQEVLLEPRVEPQILGGAVVQVGDLLIDGSIRGRLHALAQSLN